VQEKKPQTLLSHNGTRLEERPVGFMLKFSAYLDGAKYPEYISFSVTQEMYDKVEVGESIELGNLKKETVASIFEAKPNT
jgi:hypothetical protein